MKVVLVHITNSGTGGGVAQMRRLHEGLLRRGVDSKILCLGFWESSEDAFLLKKSKLVKKAEKLLHPLAYRTGLNDLHRISAFTVKDLPEIADADILDLHGIHHGVFNYLALPGLAARKPILMTMHDMWAFTGHCHASWDCERWKTGCGRCPHPEIAPAIRRDSTRIEWKLKRYAYRRAPMTLICGSRWLESLVRQSILADHPVEWIPWGIDTDVYRPLDGAACRTALGIPADRKVLLFVVDDLRRYLKGGDLLVAALGRMPERVRRDLFLLLLGRGGRELAEAAGGIPTLDLGYVTSERIKVMAYTAADLFVLPTRADNAPCTVVESFACGTPVVSFRVGGIPDLVLPGETGWLAPPEDAAALADAMIEAVNDDSGRRRMSRRCREAALADHALDVYVDRYLQICERVLQDRGRGADVRASAAGAPRATVEENVEVIERG